MRNKRDGLRFAAVVLALVLLIQPAEAYAFSWGKKPQPRQQRNTGRYYPASGKAVFSLPLGFISLAIGGTKYFYRDRVFYRHAQNGYVIVSQPDAIRINFAGTPQECFTVNVPNRWGGYTSITIKKRGNGFIGPQGEYYQEFPQIEQLRLMYGQ